MRRARGGGYLKVRSLLVIAVASLVLGGSGAALNVPQLHHVRELLNGILEDVAGIASSFAGGPNDPHSPVTDKTALSRDKARLDAATAKAYQLADELARLRDVTMGDNTSTSNGRGR